MIHCHLIAWHIRVLVDEVFVSHEGGYVIVEPDVEVCWIEHPIWRSRGGGSGKVRRWYD